MEHNDELQDYRRGRLSAEERAAVEARLQREPELTAELRRRQDLQRAIGASDAADMKAELQALEGELSGAATPVVPLRAPARHRLRIWLAAAAVLLLLGAGLWLYSQFQTATTPAELYATYYAPYPNALAPVVRGNEDLSPRERAMAAYEGGDYPSAAAQLAALPDATLDTQFYQAISLLESERTGEAIQLLERLSTARFAYQPQAQWYLALANLRAERVAEARAALEALQRTDSDYRATEVAALLDALGAD